MLFLVIDHIKLAFVKPDIALAEMTMLKQTFDVYKDLEREGKLKFSYAFADSPGGVTLWNVESNEELQRILFLLPSMPLVKRTVKPLTEMIVVEGVIEELSSIVSSMPKELGEKKEE
ncbi:MAG TPA: muconolactone Delta-isomerase family protein [Nitrososphaeraceae archaeon]|jgi:muconolactone D-isomerase|nr:muconolactone Delta-isomerase family protein [Nitrososphaeraceae archaeon]